MPKNNRKTRPRKDLAEISRTRIRDTIEKFEFGGHPRKDNRKPRPRQDLAENARTRIRDTIKDFKFGVQGEGHPRNYNCENFEQEWKDRTESIVGRVESALHFLDFCTKSEDHRKKSS